MRALITSLLICGVLVVLFLGLGSNMVQAQRGGEPTPLHAPRFHRAFRPHQEHVYPSMTISSLRLMRKVFSILLTDRGILSR